MEEQLSKQPYNFKAARQRIAELTAMYRQLKKTHEDDGAWSWWIMAEIDELEREIQEAHEKRTALQSDPLQNVISINIPQWSHSKQEEGVYAKN